ncbi:hypothetical protein LuPra_03963 [Luteitalea pratensis]|uniref:Uncharacterized protein n=1 Tax=Luteitalea pratensis TaxID=1855912 RepID=A0A143PSD8_LUTPR|nr:hypothetical protein [Luteitalea pratensis]AMY10724.1 hypothetical protein LuPra_03963 [Luteitalea pratensis]
MSRITPVQRVWKLRVVVVVILISGLGTVVAARQNPGSVIALLEQIRASLTTLQESVDGLAAANESNVAFTPMVHFYSGVLTCGVVNIADSARAIRTELIDVATGQVAAGWVDSAVEPQHDSGSSNLYASESPGQYFCKVLVLNGTNQDIRAALLIQPAPAATTALVVAAQ